MVQNQAPEIAKQSLARVVWKIFKFYFFFTLPVSFSFLLWLIFRTEDFSSLSNHNLRPLIPFAAQQILDGFPFSKTVIKFFMKSTEPHTISLSEIWNGIVKSLLTYTLVDSAKTQFCRRNETAHIETQSAHIAKLICIYGTWTMLLAFVSELLLSDGYQHIKGFLPPAVSQTTIYIGLSILLFFGAVLRFRYFTKARWALSIAWILTDKLLFSVVAGFLLTLLSMWGYFQFQKDGIEGVIIPLLIYILIAASMDLLRNRVRYLIVSLFSKKR